MNRGSKRIRTLPSATSKVQASNLAWIVTAIRTQPIQEVLVIDLRDRVLVKK